MHKSRRYIQQLCMWVPGVYTLFNVHTTECIYHCLEDCFFIRYVSMSPMRLWNNFVFIFFLRNFLMILTVIRAIAKCFVRSFFNICLILGRFLLCLIIVMSLYENVFIDKHEIHMKSWECVKNYRRIKMLTARVGNRWMNDTYQQLLVKKEKVSKSKRVDR